MKCGGATGRENGGRPGELGDATRQKANQVRNVPGQGIDGARVAVQGLAMYTATCRSSLIDRPGRGL